MSGEADDPIGGLLAVEGKHAYLTTGGSLLVVDVSDPTHPRVVGSYDRTNQATALAVSGGRAYLAGDRELRVIDLANPMAPRGVGRCDLGREFGETAWGVAVQGRYAYITDGGSVVVIDVSDPATPKKLGRCEVECGESITVAGQYAYLACDVDGVRIVSVADPTAPKPIGTWKGPANALETVVAGNLAFVTGGEDGVELWIGDISDPAAPKTIGRYGDGMSGGVAIQGKYAYVACGHLDVVDISNPAAPKLAGFYRDDECLTAWRVAVSGDYVYVTGEGKEGFSILRAEWAERDGKEPEAKP